MRETPNVTQSHQQPLFDINAFWIGDHLPVIEQICMLSMLKQGHKLRVFSYEAIKNLPAGVARADANEIVRKSDILKYARQNLQNRQMASNIFRYRLMQHNLGLWLDLDMLLLKPIPQSPAPVFGYESQAKINTAVLYLPPAHDLLNSMIKFTETPFPIPPFLPPRMRFGLWRRHLIKRPVHAADMPWGVFGPRALTYFVNKQNLSYLAAPVKIFYPIYFENAHGPLTAGWDTSSHLTDATIGIHLWSHNLYERSALRPHVTHDQAAIEPGSFLANYARQELGLTKLAA